MGFCLIEAHKSKLLGGDEPITIQISEFKQLSDSFNPLFLQCLKLHILHWALANIQAVTERDISHGLWPAKPTRKKIT